MAAAEITIEDEVMFGPYCVVVSGEHVRVESAYRNDRVTNAPIVVGEGTWVASLQTSRTM